MPTFGAVWQGRQGEWGDLQAIEGCSRECLGNRRGLTPVVWAVTVGLGLLHKIKVDT